MRTFKFVTLSITQNLEKNVIQILFITILNEQVILQKYNLLFISVKTDHSMW